MSATETLLELPASLQQSSNVLHRRVDAEPLMVKSTDGMYLVLADGTRILDGSAGAAVASVGHGNPQVIAAMKSHLDNGPGYVYSMGFTTSPSEELADILVGSHAGGLSRALFVSGGSEANDGALKLARQYFLEIGQPQRVNYIARDSSYHGNTVGALSVSGHKARRANYLPILAHNVGHVPACYPYREQLANESDAEYVERLRQQYEAEFERLGGDSVIAFIAEPVVGATLGAVPAVPGYFRMVRELCDKYGCLLMLDEVMSGMGRTGTLHAWEQEGVYPDIQTCAKGLGGGYQPIAAILIGERVMDALEAGSRAFVHGHTYQAHPMACATAVAVQKYIRDYDLLANVRAMGEYFSEAVSKIGLAELPIVGNIRGRGLFWGIELVHDKGTKAPFPAQYQMGTHVTDALLKKHNIYILAAGGSANGVDGDHLMIMPPYIVEKKHIDDIVAALYDVLKDASAEASIA